MSKSEILIRSIMLPILSKIPTNILIDFICFPCMDRADTKCKVCEVGLSIDCDDCSNVCYCEEDDDEDNCKVCAECWIICQNGKDNNRGFRGFYIRNNSRNPLDYCGGCEECCNEDRCCEQDCNTKYCADCWDDNYDDGASWYSCSGCDTKTCKACITEDDIDYVIIGDGEQACYRFDCPNGCCEVMTGWDLFE